MSYANFPDVKTKITNALLFITDPEPCAIVLLTQRDPP